jgi:hypothetical protein
MPLVFDTILSQGVRGGQIPARTQEAREWYRNTAKTYNNVTENQFIKGAEATRFSNSPMVGQMYMFRYDAKWKEELPYWDKFPLVFPFKKIKGGFLGLNMHYLPLTYRAQLMDALYTVTNNQLYNETTKLKLTYDVLNGVSKFRFFKPTIKHYLTDHMTSRFLYIYPAEWDMALFLPLEKFQKANKQEVWKDSRKIIGR